MNDESVCYFGNADKKKIKLEFKPIIEGKEDYPKTLYVKTEVRLDGQIINNTSEVHKAGKDKESGGYAGKKVFSFELESKIAQHNNIIITCFWSADGEGNWQQVMEYAPIVYTTLRQAANDQYGKKCNLDEHLLYFTCSLLPDFSEQAVFNAIWAKIKGLKLNTNDFGLNTGIPIGYYFFGNAAKNLEDLLVHNNGICNAFQDLMIKSLQTQGVSSIEKDITFSNEEEFLVKSWTYSDNGTSGNTNYPHINTYELSKYEPVFLSSGKYRWVGNPEVDRIPDSPHNLGGQNNNYPIANFYIHQIVEYNGRIYDPSYGKDFDDIDQWKDNSVDGVFIRDKIELRDGTKANAWLIKKL